MSGFCTYAGDRRPVFAYLLGMLLGAMVAAAGVPRVSLLVKFPSQDVGHMMPMHAERMQVCVCVCVKTVIASRIGAWLPGSKKTAARGARQTDD